MRDRSIGGISTLCTALLCTLCACSGSPPLDQRPFDWHVTSPTLATDGFLRGRSILAGFDSTSKTPLAGGDRALYGIELREGESIETRYLLITTAVDTGSETAVLPQTISQDVTVFDAEARVIDEVRVEVDRGALLSSIVDACPPGDVSEINESGVGAGTGDFAMSTFVAIVSKTPELRELLWKVITKPSFLSTLGGLCRVDRGARRRFIDATPSQKDGSSTSRSCHGQS